MGSLSISTMGRFEDAIDSTTSWDAILCLSCMGWSRRQWLMTTRRLPGWVMLSCRTRTPNEYR